MCKLFTGFFVLGICLRHILELLVRLSTKPYNVLRVLLEKQEVFFLKQRF